MWNQRGEDLYKFAYANVKKDRRQRNITLTLQVGTTKEYKFRLLEVKSSKGTVSKLPPGKYKIQARMASVRYVNGRYETSLYHSNTVEVVVF